MRRLACVCPVMVRRPHPPHHFFLSTKVLPSYGVGVGSGHPDSPQLLDGPPPVPSITVIGCLGCCETRGTRLEPLLVQACSEAAKAAKRTEISSFFILTFLARGCLEGVLVRKAYKQVPAF